MLCEYLSCWAYPEVSPYCVFCGIARYLGDFPILALGVRSDHQDYVYPLEDHRSIPVEK